LLDLKPAGVILFSRNVESPEQVAQFNHDLQSLALDHWSEGLLIGVDQEGGRVRRLCFPLLSCPSARRLALSTNPENLIRSYSTITAHQLRLLGFNTNFVPVLDLVDESSHDAGSVIGDRSYGNDPEVVTRYGKAVMECHKSEGMISCGKHFPGHGGTSVDSHVDLPIDSRSREILETHDMIPFKYLTARGMDMIMTAHVMYPALDPKLPATLSRTIVGGILRGKMGYDGVVITDDLDMGAIANHYDPHECSRLALMAGVDLLLFSRYPEKTLLVRDGLLAAVQKGKLSSGRVSESLGRVKSLKDRYKSSMVPADIYAAADHFRLGKQS
jgi:beta-N-acetylhexosaminidase